jgi:hypothetical protein
MGVIIAQIQKKDSKYSQTVRQAKRRRVLVLRLSIKRKKGGGREASPFCSSSVRLGAVHRSAAPWPPTGWPRSTLGAMGLSFRVRNGTGRAPHALAADRWAAPTVTVSWVSSTCPGGRMAHRGGDSGASSCPDRAHERWVPRAARCGSGRARAISAARLRLSPALHLPSIDQVVYLGPYRKEN